MGRIKISIIGAGSGCFSLGIVRDICMSGRLGGSTVSFMDIDSQRLDAVYTLCKRYAEEMGADLKIEATTNRRQSLAGADFVISTALAAGHDRLKQGWKIALKHGFRFPGSYHILYDEAFWVNYYQLKLMEAVTEDILDICPRAWHLMVMNPVVAGTTHLLRKYPQAKMVGLCHGYAEVYSIANDIGIGRDNMKYQMCGVNHFVWLTHLHQNGEDMLPKLYNAANGSDDPRKRLYSLFGVHPVGDTASWTGALWPWWNNPQGADPDFWQDDPNESSRAWDGYFNFVAKNAEDIKKYAYDPAVKVTEIYPPKTDDELIIPLVESIACDIPRVFIVNTQNTYEFVPGIPKDFEVEIPALCSGMGIQGIQTGGLPKQVLLHTLRDRVVPVEMELEAFTRGSRDLLIQLILMDKYCASVGQARDFLEEILALPYHGEMREHYQ